MSRRCLTKLYDRLTPEERFRLRVRASARGDRADAARLDRTCPPAEYRHYCARLDAADEVTLCALLELLPALARLQMVAAVRPVVAYLEALAEDAAAMAYLDGFARAWQQAGKRGHPPEVSDDDLTAAVARVLDHRTRFSALLDQIAVELARKARTPRDALHALAASDLGLDIADLLGAWAAPALVIVTEHQAALDAAEVDAQGVELLRDVLRLAWRRRGLGELLAEPDELLRARLEAAARGGGVEARTDP